MGIFSRLTDIVNSNINAILDTAEDPEKIIRLMIQEMEDTLVEVRSSAAKAIADQKDVERRLGRLADSQKDWEKKAELALSKGREDLATGALIEKAKLADMAKALAKELDHLKEALGKYEEDVVKLEAKLREAKAKKATIDARHKTATSRLKVRRNIHSTRILDAFERFDKVETRLDRIEGEAEAYDLGKGKGQSLADQITQLEAEESIQKELKALKSKMQKAAAPKKAAAK